jgi:hypothetical protein
MFNEPRLSFEHQRSLVPTAVSFFLDPRGGEATLTSLEVQTECWVTDSENAQQRRGAYGQFGSS